MLCRYLVSALAWIGSQSSQATATDQPSLSQRTELKVSSDALHGTWDAPTERHDSHARRRTSRQKTIRKRSVRSSPEKSHYSPISKRIEDVADLYDFPAALTKGSDLRPALAQHITNGKSLLGTKDVKSALPAAHKLKGFAFGEDNRIKGTGFQAIKDEYPLTGVTRHYDFKVSEEIIAPDGVERPAILINNAFPGPTIEANYGDWIEVKVSNNLLNDGTSLHWHGLLQKHTPWMDGVPSVQQCPIPPGQTFTYKFRADQVGTSWWHSHFSAQYTAGAYGAIVIHGENESKEYDEDLGPVFLTDWYHEPMKVSLNESIHNANQQPPPSDNLLINGKMNYPCANTTLSCTQNAGLSKFFMEPGKKYRLRLINPGSAANAKFSIDNHKLTVVAHDFTPLLPYRTDVVTIANGQRSDVIVEANDEAGSAHWMRFDLGDPSDPNVCNGAGTASTRSAVAVVYYSGADENAVPMSTSAVNPNSLLTCDNDPLEQTIPKEVISAKVVGQLAEITMDINFTQINDDGQLWNQWTVNGVAYQADNSRPLLAKVHNDDYYSANDQISLYNTKSADTVRIIMYDHFPFAHHPMHLHGHNFQILATGYGTWDGVVTNPSNPTRRDVAMLERAKQTSRGIIPAYTVIQFFTDNPGLASFHCHVAWHNSAGLFVNILTRPEEVKNKPIPEVIEQTCTQWNLYTSSAAYNADSIGAGV